MGRKDELLKSASPFMEESLGLPNATKNSTVESSASAAAASASPPAGPAADRYTGYTGQRNCGLIELARIVPDPGQPRKSFDPAALTGLAATIRARGILQPLRVRWDAGQGIWVLLAGERRWRAAHVAGLSAVPCVCVEGELDLADRLEEQLTENIQREDLNPMDRADALARLIELHGWSGADVARQLGLDPGTVTRSLSLRALTPDLREKVRRGELPARTAAEIARLEDGQEQGALAARVAAEGLSKEATAEIVRGKSTQQKIVRGKNGAGERPPRAKMPRLFGESTEKLPFTVPGGTVEVCLVRQLPSNRDLVCITIGPANLLPLPASLRHGDVPGVLMELAALLEGGAGRAAA